MTIDGGPVIVAIFAIVFFVIVVLDLFRHKRLAEKYKEKYQKELSIRKSSEVRLGKIGEQLAPFIKDWPWDHRHFRFLGNPVDGIHFGRDEVVFVEIKTGKARLSKTQKHIKQLILNGKIRFVTFKVTEKGNKLIEAN